jgi:hypothetical protein
MQSATSGRAPSEDLSSARSDRGNAPPQTLSARDRARLEGILARLTSPYESERATAAQFASAFLVKYGLTWSYLVSLLELGRSAVGTPVDPPRDLYRRGGNEADGYRVRRFGSPGHALDVVA